MEWCVSIHMLPRSLAHLLIVISDKRKPVFALALMLLDYESFYHESLDPKEKIVRDTEWTNELRAAQYFARQFCIHVLELPKRTSLKQLLEVLKELIQEGHWTSEGQETVEVPLLEQTIVWPLAIPFEGSQSESS